MDETNPAQQHEGSSGGEEDELFGNVVSSTTRGSSEAAAVQAEEAVAPSTGGDKEFSLNGRSLSDVPLDDIAQMDQADQPVRATAATEFHFPAKTTYRSMGSTLVDSNLAGLGVPSPLMNPSQKPLGTETEGEAGTGASELTAPSTEGLAVMTLMQFYRLETHTHSKLQLGERTEEDAVVAISLSLKKQKVDFEFKAHKSKWKCCHAHDAVCVFFVVRLWKRAPPATGHVVEFQRRHGDATAFMTFYRATVQTLHAQGMTAESKPQPAFGRPALQLSPFASSSTTAAGLMGHEVPTMQQSVPSEDEIDKFVTPLKEMVESKLLDSVLEGTRALAQLSVCPEHRMSMHRCGVVQALLDFLADAATFGLLETAAQIFAIATLANMSEEPIVQSSIYGACPMLLGRVANGEYSDRAMRREAARTLRNIAQDDEGADAMIKQCGKKQLTSWCMETLPNLEDQTMRQDAQIVQQKLQQRWAVV